MENNGEISEDIDREIQIEQIDEKQDKKRSYNFKEVN